MADPRSKVIDRNQQVGVGDTQGCLPKPENIREDLISWVGGA